MERLTGRVAPLPHVDVFGTPRGQCRCGRCPGFLRHAETATGANAWSDAKALQCSHCGCPGNRHKRLFSFSFASAAQAAAGAAGAVGAFAANARGRRKQQQDYEFATQDAALFNKVVGVLRADGEKVGNDDGTADAAAARPRLPPKEQDVKAAAAASTPAPAPAPASAAA